MKKTFISIFIIILVGVGIFVLMNVKKQDIPSSNQGIQDVSIKTLVEGIGEEVLQPGKIAVVHYTGMLIDGIVFDSSLTYGEPFEFMFGVGDVISGWDQGLHGMKIGEKRRLIIPSSFGYGSLQVGPIPPNSILIFEIELLDIR